MFDWLTKPYMQWTFIDNLLSTIEIAIISILIIIIGFYIVELKDKIKNGRNNKRNRNK
jgi:hypothetical protein